MIPVVSIVGYSNSGKTTLIEKIIPLLKDKGYKIGTIKHDAHEFEIDHQGKDTWRMRRAGADVVTISSEIQMAMIKTVYAEENIDEIVKQLFKDVHLVITEGYKASNKPKIEIIRFKNPLIMPENNLIGIVDNTSVGEVITLPKEYKNINKFKIDDVNSIADFIEERFLSDVEL
ncbi:molybdopterin-guanine dinucleotide biosynthesis protein B [Clostridium sp. YIM B02551]|uniref:molybdopterin-guanine dinucleotide biosynthesis protein B n=1 Tax=Clostridium sp. YIM B02551 TaxID=2910679 RepID=UPI001EEC9B0D|nr:molybdopterin-guanine dinucleotide biosynthesis protein B [Clostridium sp. YIM B02551]